MYIDENKIPDDIDEYYNNTDILFHGDKEFDEIMIERGYFTYGGTRRSHRVITDKFHNTKFKELYKDLTSKDYIETNISEDEKRLFDLAEKLNYKLTKG